MVTSMDSQRFGRLLVVARDGSDKRFNALWRCQCDCGKTVTVASGNLRSGNTTSCGCLAAEKRTTNRLVHGGARRKAHTPEYRTWAAMRARCSNPSNKDWPNYGGRGIGVCVRWLESFSAFVADMGQKPTPAHTIDRIDHDGNYEPGNCQWATSTAQNNNRRDNKLIEHDGLVLTTAEWSRRTGIARRTIANRIAAGISPGAALTGSN